MTPMPSDSDAPTKTWGVFTNAKTDSDAAATPVVLPDPPPWRCFDPEAEPPYPTPPMPAKQRERGKVFRLPRNKNGSLSDAAEDVRLAVNAAIHLRRPLLVTGTPGCGKTSLAYAIAYELGLGRVLTWPITPRSEVQEGLYRYEALDRLRQSQPGSEASTAEFITLGPLGTAFLPFAAPRVLLIDEIDKSDLQLPNELLHLFEEGCFEIPQLRREARHHNHPQAELDTDDPGAGCRAPIQAGRVQCREFPIVVMTSNRERDFPPAFHRRCIRVDMPVPSLDETLLDVARQHFGDDLAAAGLDEKTARKQIESFLGDDGRPPDRATDQLLNALHLLRGPDAERPSEKQMEDLAKILFKRLSASG
jgi:MoxR-like ATPase